MAAYMKIANLLRTNFRLLPNSPARIWLPTGRQYNSALAATAHSSSQLEIQTVATVEYPPVKPQYPSGRWGNLNPTSAWHLQRLTDSLRKIPSVKRRLDTLAGDKNKVLWVVEPFDKRPNNLAFKQYLTKTHVVHGLPPIYDNVNVDEVYDEVKEALPEIITQELDHVYKAKLQPNIDGTLFVDVKR